MALSTKPMGSFFTGITGLSASTPYYYRCSATNSAGTSWATSSSPFTTSAPTVTLPTITNTPATNITTSSATLNGNLTSTGNATTTVRIYWGDNDAGTGTWDNNINLSARTVGAFSSAISGLSATTTYYYRCSATNSAGTAWATPTAYFTTSTLPATVISASASNVAANTATLNGTLANLNGNTSATVSFLYGTADPPVTPVVGVPSSLTSAGNFSAQLTSLNPNTTYYFKAVGVGSGGATVSGLTMSFNTNQAPPAVTTSNASNVTTTSATLSGNLINLNGNSSATVSFLYGTTTSPSTPVAGVPSSLSSTGSFSAQVTLKPNTTYYFKAVGLGSGGLTGMGSILSFTTQKLPPTVITNAASNIGTTTATLNGRLTNLNSNSSANVAFEYGLTTAYGKSIAGVPSAFSSPGNFSAVVSLEPNTTYHFRAVGQGSGGLSNSGADVTFTTQPVLAISTTGSSGVSTTSASLTGNLDSLGLNSAVNVYFEYGTSQGYENNSPIQVKSSTGSYTLAICNLLPNTTYNYRAVAVSGTEVVHGINKTFATAVNPVLSVSTNLASAISNNSATVNGNLISLGLNPSATVSFIYGTSQQALNMETTTQTLSAIGTFSSTLTGLSTETLYYYKSKVVGTTTEYGEIISLYTHRSTGGTGTTTATYQVSSSTDDIRIANNGSSYYVPSAQDLVSAGRFYGSAWQKVGSGFRFRNIAFADNVPIISAYLKFTSGGHNDGGGIYTKIHGQLSPDASSFSGTYIDYESSTRPRTAAVVPWNGISGWSVGTLSTSPDISSVIKEITNQPGWQSGNNLVIFWDDHDGYSCSITALDPMNYTCFRSAYSYETDPTKATRLEIIYANPPTVVSGDSILVMPDSATLTGNLNGMGGASTATVSLIFRRGSDNYTSESSLQTTTMPGDFSIGISGLNPATTYYYKAKVSSGCGTSYGLEKSLTTGYSQPIVANGTPIISGTSAILNGNLISLGTASCIKTSFVWGTASGSLNNESIVQSQCSTNDLTCALTSLDPATVYYYRIKALGQGDAVYSDEASFTTGLVSPAVITAQATDITISAAILSGTLFNNGGQDCRYRFCRGTSPGIYTDNTSWSTYNITTGQTFNANINGLPQNTTYYYVAQCNNDAATGSGLEQSFKTAASTPEVNNASGASSIMATTAIIHGNLINTGGLDTTVIIYGGTSEGGTPEVPSGSWSSSENLGITAAGPFSLGVTGLAPNTTYYYRCYATNAEGDFWATESSAFTTQADLGLWRNYWTGPGKDWWWFSSGGPQ